MSTFSYYYLLYNKRDLSLADIWVNQNKLCLNIILKKEFRIIIKATSEFFIKFGVVLIILLKQ